MISNYYKSVVNLAKSEPFKNFFIYGLGALFLKGVSFFLLPFYTKILSPKEYGQVELINTLILFISTLVSLGIPSYLFMEYFHLSESQRQKFLLDILSIYFLISTPIYILLAIILIGFLNYLFPGDFQANSIYIALAYVYLIFFQSVYINILLILKKAKIVTIYRVLIGIGIIILNLFLLKILKTGIAGIFVSLLSLTLCSLLYPLWIHRSVLSGFRISIKREFISKTLKVSVILMISYLAYFALNFIDRWFILYFLGEERVGIYSIAFKFASTFEALLITPALSVYTVHVFSKFSIGDFNQNLAFIIPLIVIFFFVSSLIVVPVARIMITQKFYSSLNLIVPLVVGYSFYFLSQLNSLILVYNKDSTRILINVALALIINIISNYFLIKLFFLYGAAYAFLTSNILWFIVSYIQGYRVKKEMVFKLNPLK